MKWISRRLYNTTGMATGVTRNLELCLILDILKIFMDFGSYDAFSSSDVPEKVNQQNSWNSLVISTYLLYLE
jgi:hypothetical protein